MAVGRIPDMSTSERGVPQVDADGSPRHSSLLPYPSSGGMVRDEEVVGSNPATPTASNATMIA
jgi:hypothetical protein